MSNEKHYPLHPGQTQPLLHLTQVPTEEYEALKREVQQLREITSGNRSTIDDVVEINTLTSEVKALREMNAKLQGEKIKLEAENRWHRCDKPNSDGLYDLPPESGEYVIQYELNGKKYVTSATYEADYNDWNELRYGSNVIQWRELPHPKE